MSHYKRLIVLIAAFALLIPLPPAQAQTKKGNKFLAEGSLHEAKKEWDAALECYEKARSEDPTDPVYQIAVEKGRAHAAQTHVEKGIVIRGQGQLGEALVEFQKANALNPASVIALQELRETQQMIVRERKRVEQTGQQAPPEVKALTPGQAAQQEEVDKVARMLPVPELRPTRPGAVDLKMTGKTKTIFEALGKYAGLNVLWDPDYVAPQHDNFTVDFRDSTLTQALDSIAAKSKSQWKRLSPTVLFVTNESPR